MGWDAVRLLPKPSDQNGSWFEHMHQQCVDTETGKHLQFVSGTVQDAGGRLHAWEPLFPGFLLLAAYGSSRPAV
jgi:hypothetical protein